MATLTELEADLELYRKARSSILNGQSYRMGGAGGVELVRPDLRTVERKISELEIRIQRLKGPTHSYPVFGGRS